MDDNDACELVEGYDPLKDFAERKPSWCGGGLVVKEYNDCTKYYGDSCWEIDREEEVRGEDYCR